MTSRSPRQRFPSPTRRRFLIGGATLAAGGTAAGVAVGPASSSGDHPHVEAPTPVEVPLVALGRQPDGLPDRQHALTATLNRDADGNAAAPRFDRLLFFDVRGQATARHARLLEAALRTLERRYRWGPDGLLITTGGVRPSLSPSPHPRKRQERPKRPARLRSPKKAPVPDDRTVGPDPPKSILCRDMRATLSCGRRAVAVLKLPASL